MKFTLFRLSFALSFAFGLSACGQDDTPSGPESCASGTCLCVSDEDCTEGEQCVDLECVPASEVGADTGVDTGSDTVTDILGDGVDDTGLVPGACTDDRNNEILLERLEEVDECPMGCAAAPQPSVCTESCLTGLGLSEECAACRGVWTVCVVEACPMCLEDFDQACFECFEGALSVCDPGYVACAGDRPNVDPPDAPLVPGCDEDEQASVPADWFDGGTVCVEECAGEESPCIRDCLASAFATSFECALCFTDQIDCADDICVEACAEPDSDECGDCRNGACIVSLEECVGVDLLEEPEQRFSRLRLVHLSPGLAGANGYQRESGTEFASNVPFGNASDSTERVPVFGTGLDVHAATEGISGDVLFAETGEAPFGPNEVSTMVIYGPAEEGASWLVSHDLGERPSGARWRFFNASVSLGAVDIYQTLAGVREDVAMDLSYGSSTAGIEIEPAEYLVGVDIDDDSEPDYEFAIARIEVGQEIALFLFDDGGSEVFLMAVWSDGQTIRFNPRS
jgi:hypothetical protein